MNVAPRSFRPRISDFLRQTVGCTNLGCALPVVVLLPVLLVLPWNQKTPAQEWGAAAIKGLLIGIMFYVLFVIVSALIKRHSSDVKESKTTAAAANETLNRALEGANSARALATTGSQLVDEAFSCFSAPEYVPFWEAVENSETHLRRCCEWLADIHGCRLRYKELLLDRDHSFPDLDTEIGVLFDPRPDMQRLGEVVRLANRDSTFSVILAQRATTSAVERGFEQLTAAVNQLERSVTNALEDLKKSLVSEIRKSTAIQTKILQGVQFIATNKADAHAAGR